MKKTIKSLYIKIIGCMLLFCVLVGGINLATHNANASTTEQSVGNRYFTSTSGTVESFLNKSATNQSLYKGIRTEVSDLTVGEDVTVYYNGLVSPNAANSAVVYYDENNAGTMDAEAIIWTYTLANDRSKQLSIVNIRRSSSYYMTIALTDDIEIRDGYAYLAGTNQKTVGLSGTKADSPYNGEGFPGNISAEHKITAEGAISYNKTSQIALILSDEFLQAASENLAGTKYEHLYTKEYIQSLLTAFGTGSGDNTSILSLTYKSVRQEKIAFHLRGISGQWIGDNGGTYPWSGANTSGFVTQKKTTIFLNADNNLADLFNLHTIYAPSGTNVTTPFGIGHYGTNETGEGGILFEIENGETNASYRPTEYGKFYVSIAAYIAPNYSELGSNSSTTLFEFDVVDGNPIVSGVEGISLIEGVEYDLSTFFDVWYLGNQEKGVFAYEVDGFTYSENKLLADGNDHEIKLTVTDEYGNTGYAVHTFYGSTIRIPAQVSHTVISGDFTILPVPHVPHGASYTLCLKDENGEVLTNDVVYVFQKAGKYTIEYTFTAKGATSIIKTTELTISFKGSMPTLTVEGAYEKEYFVGETVALLPAIAVDELGTQYTVSVLVFCGTENIEIQDGKVSLAKAGIYSVAYSISYDNGKTMRVEKAFKAVKDTVAPEIVVKGTYADSYQTGTIISVFDIVTIDDSGLPVESSVIVYCNGNELVLTDKVFALTEEGTYEIVYTATDLGGNETKKSFTITVGIDTSNDSNKGCKSGCNSTMGATLCAVIPLLGMVLLMRKKES